MAFGTAIHHAIELLKNRDVSKRPSVDDAKVEFVHKLITEEAKFRDTLRVVYDLSVFVESGHRIIEHIDDVPELKDSVVWANEYLILEDIARSDGLELKFKGYVDFIVKMPAKRGNKTVLWILDFKTCSWGWSFQDINDPYKQLQLLLYKHFICKIKDVDPRDVRVAFVLLKKRPRPGTSPIEVVPISSGPKSLERAVETLQRTISEMHSGVYWKDTSSCVNKYKNRCAHLGTDRCDAPVLAQ